MLNFKVAIIGDPAVGKTSSVRRFVDDKFVEAYLPTLGFEISVKALQIGEKALVMSIWDMGAQQCFDPIRLKYYQDVRGFLVMFNLAMRGTFKNLGNWIPDAQKTCPDASIIIVGNKCDLPERVVSDEEIAEAVKNYGITGAILASAKTGQGIAEAFAWLGESMVSNIPGSHEPESPNSAP